MVSQRPPWEPPGVWAWGGGSEIGLLRRAGQGEQAIGGGSAASGREERGHTAQWGTSLHVDYIP